MADSKRESREEVSANNVGDLSIRIDADVSGAITGFKALQRVLRKTAQEARELESAYKDVEEAFKLTKPIAEKCGVSDTELLTSLVVQMDGKEVGKSVMPTVKELQTQTLLIALENETNIPERLRRELLAKISEDEAIIAELERKVGDLSGASTKELHEKLAKRVGVREINISAGNAVFLRDGIGEIGRFEGPARILVNKD